MKTILVPTDFSDNAANALDYAVALAKKSNSRILLLHVYQIPYPVSDTPLPYTIDQIEAIRKGTEKQLKEIYTKISAENVKCTFLNKEGLIITDAIIDVIVKRRVSLVVMGTKGASGLRKVVMGSNTARLVEHANCPVLVIPEGTRLKSIKKITYATAYHTSDVTTLKKLLDLPVIDGASIRLLHVSDNSNDEVNEKKRLKEIVAKMKEKTGYTAISGSLVYGKNIEVRLQEYVAEKHPDMLVMSTHYRTVYDRFFRISATKRTAYHSLIPLMVFHHKRKSVAFT